MTVLGVYCKLGWLLITDYYLSNR